MTIKQQGGVFGRNPTFNDVTIEGDLEIDGTLKFDGDIDINSDLKVNGDLEVLGQSALGATIPSDAHATWSQYFVGEKGSVISEKLNAGGLFGMWLTDNVYVDTDTGSFAYLTTDEASAVRCEAGEIEFRSAPSGTAGAAMTLTQYAKFTTAGNLAFISGNGIDFSATSDGSGTTTSELLDDYEEGTWLPTYTPLTGDNWTATYGEQAGYYRKIGNIVICTYSVRTATLVKGTATASAIAELTGLPFAISQSSQWYSLGLGTDFLVNQAGSLHSVNGTSSMRLQQANNNTNILVSDFNTAGSRNFTSGYFAYITA